MLLIFDIDDTLCNSKEVGDKCFIETFETLHKCSLQNIQWENYKNVTDTGLYADLIVQYTEETDYKKSINLFCDTYKTKLFQTLKYFQLSLVNTANTFIQKAQNQNISMAIATGNWQEIAEIKLKHCDFDYYNIPMSSSNDAFTREEIIVSVIEKSKSYYNIKHFEKIIYFGDGLWDYQCAKNLNIEFIGVDVGHNKKLLATDIKLLIADFTNTELIFKYIHSL